MEKEIIKPCRGGEMEKEMMDIPDRKLIDHRALVYCS